MAATMVLSFVLLLVLSSTTFSSGVANQHHRPVRSPMVTCRYDDARDHYFQQPFRYGTSPDEDAANMVEDDSPFPADKCRLAKEMEKEIQYLRTLMDKCERCSSSVTEMTTLLRGPNGKGVKCEDGGSSWCLGQSHSPCIDTPSGSFCGPCPVGYDRNGTKCVQRAVSCN